MGKIILADDDEIVGELVSDALIAAGHGVGWLTSGRMALDMIRRRPPDLVILDCDMPDQAGLMVLREIRRSAALRGLPVLLLTGRRSDADRDADRDPDIARIDGADGYMNKPFDPNLLVIRAEALMDGKTRV